MTAALFGFEDIPPLVPRALRGPWQAAAAVVRIDATVVDVGYERDDRRWRARLGSTGAAWRTGRVSVRVRPHLAGDELLCVLLHEAVHVRVYQTRPLGECPSHGPAFRTEVDTVCDRLGVPRPRAYSRWPHGRERAAVAAAALREAP